MDFPWAVLGPGHRGQDVGAPTPLASVRVRASGSGQAVEWALRLAQDRHSGSGPCQCTHSVHRVP